MKLAIRLLAVIAAAYVLLLAVVTTAMYQSPGTFGQVMARVPMPLMMVLPFEPLWMRARAGALEPGRMAPDFTLLTTDKARRVTLSSFRGSRPVVLVFGSYT
jgi:hypothetical protein